MEAAFKFFDNDNSGFIDANELFEAIKKFNGSITKDQVKDIIKKIDKDNSGKISIDGMFRKFCCKFGLYRNCYVFLNLCTIQHTTKIFQHGLTKFLIFFVLFRIHKIDELDGYKHKIFEFIYFNFFSCQLLE